MNTCPLVTPLGSLILAEQQGILPARGSYPVTGTLTADAPGAVWDSPAIKSACAMVLGVVVSFVCFASTCLVVTCVFPGGSHIQEKLDKYKVQNIAKNCLIPLICGTESSK